jgi:hypothetical protein
MTGYLDFIQCLLLQEKECFVSEIAPVSKLCPVLNTRHLMKSTNLVMLIVIYHLQNLSELKMWLVSCAIYLALHINMSHVVL